VTSFLALILLVLRLRPFEVRFLFRNKARLLLHPSRLHRSCLTDRTEQRTVIVFCEHLEVAGLTEVAEHGVGKDFGFFPGLLLEAEEMVVASVLEGVHVFREDSCHYQVVDTHLDAFLVGHALSLKGQSSIDNVNSSSVCIPCTYLLQLLLQRHQQPQRCRAKWGLLPPLPEPSRSLATSFRGEFLF